MKLVPIEGVYVETYGPKGGRSVEVYAALPEDDDQSGSLLHIRFRVKVLTGVTRAIEKETWLEVKSGQDESSIEIRAEWGRLAVRPVSSNVVEIVAQ